MKGRRWTPKEKGGGKGWMGRPKRVRRPMPAKRPANGRAAA